MDNEILELFKMIGYIPFSYSMLLEVGFFSQILFDCNI